MALVPPLEESPEEIRRALRPLRNDFAVALYACQNAFAVGAIIRVAHSFLAREIVLIGNEPYYAKASMGMEKYESLLRVPGSAEFFDHVAGRPIWAVEKDHATTSLFGVEAYPKNVVFVFGAERTGLPMALIQRADRVLGIPMYGVNHSFPLTVAAGIVMADWARRRYANGTVVTG